MIADPNDTLERHVVDLRKALTEYREASVRRQESPAQEYFFDSSVPDRSSVQKKKAKCLQLESRISTWKRGVLSRNKLQESGTLSPCRRRLSMSTTSSSRTGSTLLTTGDVQYFSTRIPFSPMSRSNPFTSTSASCLIR